MIALAFLATLIFTPLVLLCAKSLGIVDRPDGHRKLHGAEIPLGGGVAILGALVVTLATTLLVPNSGRDLLIPDQRFLAGLALSLLVICGVGLADDRFRLPGRIKLAGQAAAVGILILSGFHIQNLQFGGWQVNLGLLAIPFTFVWLLGTVNALNLIDGMDGLATSVGVILSLAIAGVAFLHGDLCGCFLAMMIAGSLLGFLCFNIPPAQIFLGDAGSMLIGLTLGALALRCSLKTPNTSLFFIPVALWTIPFFDVGMAILRRKLTGRSIYTTDRGHLHHCLLQRGYSGWTALLAISLVCGATAAGAVTGVWLGYDVFAVLVAAGVMGTMVASRFFGNAEYGLLCQRVKALLRSLVQFQNESGNRSQQLCTRIQGMRKWDGLWQTLTTYADQFDLTAVQLNINVPSLHEEYHARWDRKACRDRATLCDTEIPLVAGSRTVGRVKITVDSLQRDSMCAWMTELIAGLQPFESHLQSLLAEPVPSPRPKSTRSRRRSSRVLAEEGRRVLQPEFQPNS